MIAQTHARVLYSCLRLMVGHFEEVGLSMNLENIVEFGRSIFSEIFVRRPAWLLYSFLTQIFLLWVILEKEYRKQNRRMNIVKIMKIIDKVVKNLTRGK